MPRVAFEALPDHGRLWVFPLDRPLTEAEEVRTMSVVDDFLNGWAAHGMPLRSAVEVREGRFLLIGVDVDAEAPSGCSIDALVNKLRGVGQELGISFIDHAPVWFRDGDAIRSVSRSDFRAIALTDDVDEGVHVFDTSLTRVDQLRSGGLERPATETWHGRAFFKDAAGVR